MNKDVPISDSYTYITIILLILYYILQYQFQVHISQCVIGCRSNEGIFTTQIGKAHLRCLLIFSDHNKRTDFFLQINQWELLSLN